MMRRCKYTFTTRGNRMDEGKRADLKALTGLRLPAALVVLIGHYRVDFAQTNSGLAIPGISGMNILNHGTVGVDLFFILSGFILTYNYYDVSGGLRGTRRDFWIA